MKTKAIYYAMLGSMLMRLFWLTVFEPKGSQLAMLRNPDSFIVQTLPYVVYPSIVILMAIILFAALKKPLGYIAGMSFGIVHLILIMPLVVFRLHPGYSPLIVIPACLLMIVFSYWSYKESSKMKRIGGRSL